jgi:KDO2-lipid IV(A) lauroyltransferase
MNLQEFATNPRTVRFSMWLSRHVPEPVAHRLAWWAASMVSREQPAAYRTVVANLKQVLGTNVERQTVQQAARQVFSTTIRTHYDLFRALQLSPQEQANLIDFPQGVQDLVHSLRQNKRGSVLVFPHLGSFDIAGPAVAGYLPETQVITLPDPPAGFQLVNKLRLRTGVEVTPLSSTALRQAIRLLRRGGTVAIAGDRPVSDLDEPADFFGRPARVPSGHVRLALKTGALLIVGCCFLSPETGRYTIHMEPPLEMIRTGNLDEDVRLNMRQVLDGLESIIRRWVNQWQMFVPVWPEPREA